MRLVGKAPVGSTVKVVVLRNGRRKTLDVVLGQRPENITSLPPEQPAPAPEGVVGLMLLEIDDALREEKSLPETAKGLLVVGVEESSDAYAKDIREGDIITDAGQETVETVEAFKARLEATKEAGRSTILLLVRRDGQPRFVVVEIK